MKDEKPKSRRGVVRDLTGQTFGKLTVIEFVEVKARTPKTGKGKPKPYTKAMWRCKCECGNEKVIRGTSLTSGTTISCGCELKKKLSKRRTDLTGQTFGKLTVLEYAGVEPNGRTPRYKVKCECGTVKFVRGSNLTGGRTKSCGKCR